ncbi:MAG: aquaporin family protein [Verrucomicrobiales bacterium]|nr:aquaporin family protein [Verrucomicrobiales bacterium]
MNACLAEFIGTTLLVLFGNGVVANVVLPKTKGNNAGWIVITAGWGLAVFIGAFCSAKYSGAHLNPAVTVAMAMAGKLEVANVPGYIAAQMLGALVGAVLAYLFYQEHFKATDDANDKLACFCTAPNIRSLPQAFFCETVGTFCLILPIFLMVDPTLEMTDSSSKIGLGTLGLVPVALVVFAIGLCLGGTTGYAINPARDLAPRIAHFLLPVPGKRDSDWNYAWVPVLGPIFGGMLAAAVYQLIR